MNIKVRTSKKFRQEKEYLFSVIFENLLRWEYQIENTDEPGFVLEFPNRQTISIPDNFFAKLEENNGVYDEKVMPDKASLLPKDLAFDDPLHVFYGSPEIKRSENQIRLGWDIFGCIFFCLCHVDELVFSDVDEHGRFPIEKSFSFQNGFYQYPLVNSSVDLLQSLVRELFPSLPETSRKYEVIPTLDIDHPLKYQGFRGEAKKIRDVLKGGSGNPFGNIDPYMASTVRLVQKLNEWGYAPRVFFLLGQSGKNLDTILNRERSVRDVFAALVGLDFIEGLHPGYNSMERGVDQFEFEKKLLENISGNQVFSSRQHYLKYIFPSTFRDLSRSGLTQDFSIGFSKVAGFRSGICEPYMLFDPLERKNIGIMETPLTLMDRTFLQGKGEFDLGNIRNEVEKIVGEVKRYKGKLCLLLHNSTFDEPGGMDVNELFLEICAQAKTEK